MSMVSSSEETQNLKLKFFEADNWVMTLHKGPVLTALTEAHFLQQYVTPLPLVRTMESVFLVTT